MQLPVTIHHTIPHKYDLDGAYILLLMFKHWFCWKSICLILSTIYIFIPVNSSVDRDHSALLFPRSYNAVKAALEVVSIYKK
jgi:hypothetical protein